MIARRSTFALALASTALFALSAYADSRVGVTSAVNPSAAGTPPGETSRQLTVGSDIQFRERVITTTDGQAQILFLDQSSLLIGPNSTVVIDEFVYDPATNKGNIAATLTQGSFRYIGGKLSKQGNATLKTPVATLGIRGSDVTINYDAAKALMNVVTTHGSASLATVTEVLNLRGGFGAVVSGNDGKVGPPTALTAAQIAAANGAFEGQPGKNAGSGKPPTDGDVAKSGLSSSVEAKSVALTEPAAGGTPGSGAPLQVPFTPSNNDTPPTVVQQKSTEKKNAEPSSPPPAPGDTRSNRVMNGYVAGVGVTSSEGSASYRIANSVPEDVLVQTVADAQGGGRVLAKFAYHPADSAPIGSAQLQFGDPPGSAPATQSVFTDDSTFAATQASSSSAGLAKVDGQNVSAIAVLVSIPNGTPVGVFTGEQGTGPACTCTYVTWGAWTVTMQAGAAVSHTVPRGFWVAGVLPNVNDPSPTGTASFSGTAIGVIESQSGQPMASGSFTNNYNFTQRTGRVDITNFAGKSFGGTVGAGSDWRNYSGAVSGSSLNGTVNGSFYGNRDANGQLQTPKETAGNFNVQGSGFKASGVFLGAR
jgi:hypothetical protein